MNIEWWGFLALTLIDITTALIIFFCALNERMLLLPAWYKIGLIAAAFGFAAQGGLNLPYLLFDIQLSAHALPFWALKDVGIAMVACHYFWQVIRDRRKLGTRLSPRHKTGEHK